MAIIPYGEHIGELAAFLAGGHDGTYRAWGDRFGATVTISIVNRSEAEPQYWTEIEVELPRAYPLVIELRPQTKLERLAVKSRLAVDLQFGDPRFDDKFVVDAAPAKVVRALLDQRTRAYLSYHEADLRTVEDADTGRRALVLGLRGSTDVTFDHLLDPIEIVVAIAVRVRDVYATTVAQAPKLDTDDPYRGSRPDEQFSERRYESRVREVERLRAMRVERERSNREVATRVGVILLAAIAAAGLALAALH